METLPPIRRRASQHPRRANRSPRGTRPSCTLTARPCAASQKAASTPLTNHKKNPQPRFNRNQQYSITAVSDGGGSVVERYAYSAYGQVTIADASGSQISNSAIANRYTYTGREWDEGLSLYHYRARMYDAVAGRFVSRDPIRYYDGMNMYMGYFWLADLDASGTQVVSSRPAPCTIDDNDACAKKCSQMICKVGKFGIGKPRWNKGKCKNKIVTIIKTPRGVKYDSNFDCECDHDFPSDCPPALLAAMIRKVHQACDKDALNNDRLPNCERGDDEQTLNAKMDKMVGCLEAKVERGHNCFRGGDRNHVKNQGEIMQSIQNCERMISRLPR